MKAFISLRFFLAGLCLAIAVGTTTRVQAHATEQPQVCAAAEPRDMNHDVLWRWRAQQSLSCLISRLEEVKNRPSVAGRGQVTLTRDEVDELLGLAWSGRDSAQRIAR